MAKSLQTKDLRRLLGSDDADTTSKHEEQRVSFDGASQVLDMQLRSFRGHDGAANLRRVQDCVSLSERLRKNSTACSGWHKFNPIVSIPARGSCITYEM